MKYSPYIDPSLVLDLFPRGYLIWSGWDHIFSTVRFPIFLHKNLVPNRFQHWSSYFFKTFQKHWISPKNNHSKNIGFQKKLWTSHFQPVLMAFWDPSGSTWIWGRCAGGGLGRHWPRTADPGEDGDLWTRGGKGGGNSGEWDVGWTWDEHGFLGMNIWWFGMIWDEHWD